MPAFAARNPATRRSERKAQSVAGRKYTNTTANNRKAKNGRATTKASTTYKMAAIIAEARKVFLPPSAIGKVRYHEKTDEVRIALPTARCTSTKIRKLLPNRIN